MSEPESRFQTDVSDERVVTEEGEVIRHEEAVRPIYRRIHPGLIAALILAVVTVFFLGWHMLGSDESGSGRPVPAPRSSLNEDIPRELANKTLTLSPEQVQNAGITIETVGEQLSTESSETSATGTVEANAYKQTQAVSLVGGVVRSVMPELGENVSVGQAVAVIFSNEFADAQSKYLGLRTEANNARRNYERTQRLVAINQPGRSELEQAVKQRKAAEAAAIEMRSRHSRTTRLVQIGAASREELEQDTTKLRTAEADLEEARAKELRSVQLLPIGAEVRTANEDALKNLRTSEAELAASRQRMVLYGMPAARINALERSSQVSSEFTVTAPTSGTVTTRSVNPGEVIEANKELMSITDLSTVWAVAQVYENDIGRLRVGGGASVTSDAFPNRIFRGHVTYIDPQLDPATRTAKVRVELPNPDRRLKIGMYVRVALGATDGAERTVPVVSASAVQNVDGQQLVFVPTSEPNIFELRPVRLGMESNGRYEVIEGLTVGERVVVTGSFALRAEWLKSSQGTGH